MTYLTISPVGSSRCMLAIWPFGASSAIIVNVIVKSMGSTKILSPAWKTAATTCDANISGHVIFAQSIHRGRSVSLVPIVTLPRARMVFIEGVILMLLHISIHSQGIWADVELSYDKRCTAKMPPTVSCFPQVHCIEQCK